MTDIATKTLAIQCTKWVSLRLTPITISIRTFFSVLYAPYVSPVGDKGNTEGSRSAYAAKEDNNHCYPYVHKNKEHILPINFMHFWHAYMCVSVYKQPHM